MNVNELLEMFQKVEETADYQLESAIVDLTEEICEIMERGGISRADLARKLGKSRAWVTKVLRGDRNLTLKTIIDIYWALGYKTCIQAEPKWSTSADWDQEGEYETQDVITVFNKAGQRVHSAADYIEQPTSEMTEQKNVVAA